MGKSAAQRAAKHGNQAAIASTRRPVPARHNAAAAVVPAVPEPAPNSNMITIAAVGTALFLFIYLHLLVLNEMTQLSGGLAMPDSLFGGYGTGYIQQLRSAMDADALGQLSFVHRTAGTMFPLIFAAAWLLLIGRNVRRRRLRWAFWAAPVLFALVHLGQNIAVDTMLGAAVLEPGQVALASVLTAAHWLLLGLCLLIGLAVLAAAFRRRDPSRRTAAARTAARPSPHGKQAEHPRR